MTISLRDLTECNQALARQIPGADLSAAEAKLKELQLKVVPAELRAASEGAPRAEVLKRLKLLDEAVCGVLLCPTTEDVVRSALLDVAREVEACGADAPSVLGALRFLSVALMRVRRDAPERIRGARRGPKRRLEAVYVPIARGLVDLYCEQSGSPRPYFHKRAGEWRHTQPISFALMALQRWYCPGAGNLSFDELAAIVT